MGKRLINFRELISRYPWLDTFRMDFFTWWCNNGTTFFDKSYQRMRIVAPGARPFIDGLSPQPAIYAVYHGRMIALLGIKPRKQLTILISQSRDGETIARACKELGFSTARGSSGRGGVKGTLELIESTKTGHNLAFMVDGPRGPFGEVKLGIVRLAELTGLPIIPVVCHSRSAWYMKSWDNFMASSWASPMVTVFGEPVAVAPGLTDAEKDAHRAGLESEMRRLFSQIQNLWTLSESARTRHTYP